MTKLFISFLFVFFLAACGGGSGSESDSNSNSNGNNVGTDITYVVGEMKVSTGADDLYAPAHDAAYGNLGYACSINNNYYFESANVVVFGSAGYPDSDFKYAATLVENNLDSAFEKIGINKEEFSDARPYYITKVANSIIDFMSYGWDVDGVHYDITNMQLTTPFHAHSAWVDMNDQTKYKHVEAYWNALNNAEQYMFGKEFESVSNRKVSELYDGEYRMTQKIMVCLTDEMDSIVYGEGTLLGMNLPPKSYATRKYGDESQVVLHELIHTIQQNISSPVRGIGRTLDHWFKEGQATFLAGQTTASSTDGFNPVDVVTWADETSVFATTSDAYKHYALAYSYLDENNSANQMKEMLYDIRYFKGEGEISPSNHVSGVAFESAFDNNMTQKGGGVLTIQEFRADYQSLMSQ
ncbi:hypothetical protein [Colwellia sp. MB02u-14]|uniref:hypothetical protein n=1 Tax=Colwellia sp. MB02u-14 TaxID=2759815 RepID=UPI0015F6322C|nr:hypothetical protein [Colwellia sp. MB02u-14]MBA6304947.1 hypothetical protein [Colwellia sp. MB02u-14]